VIKPNANLVAFHDAYCPELSYDDIRLFYRLLDELVKIIKDKNSIEENKKMFK